jgi:hypothetical protein
MHKQIIFLFALSQFSLYVELFNGIITLLIVIKRVQINISLFLPLSVSTTLYLLIVGEEVIVAIFHTHSVGLLWTRDRPFAETSSRQHKITTTDGHPFHPMRFETIIPAREQPQTQALDRADTGIVYLIFWGHEL